MAEEEVNTTGRHEQLKASQDVSASTSSTPSSAEIPSTSMNGSCQGKRKASSPPGVDVSTLRRSKRISHPPNINVSAQECDVVTVVHVPDSAENVEISEDSHPYEDAIQYRH